MAEQGIVELVARAIYEQSPALVMVPGSEAWGIPWHHLSGEDHAPYFVTATAAIAAMREPTEAMLAAAKPEPTHLYGQGGRGEEYQAQMRIAVQVDRMVARTIWQAMCDAALATPEVSGDE